MITRFLWQGMGPSLRAAVLFVLAIGINVLLGRLRK